MSILERLDKIELDNKKLILIGLVAVTVLYLDLSMILKIQLASLGTLRNKINRIKADIFTLNTELARFANIQEKQNGAKTRQKKIISEQELPSLLETISDIANKNNVKMLQVNPVKEIKQDLKKDPRAMNFTPVHIDLNITSTYYNFIIFLKEMEELEDLVIVEDFRIKRDDSNYLVENISLKLKTYLK